MKKDKNRQLQQTGKKESSIVRSSAAKYLTFVAVSGKERQQNNVEEKIESFFEKISGNKHVVDNFRNDTMEICNIKGIGQ